MLLVSSMIETGTVELNAGNASEPLNFKDQNKTKRLRRLMGVAASMWEGLGGKDEKSRIKTVERRLKHYTRRHLKKDH
jgi:hypothetical protein